MISEKPVEKSAKGVKGFLLWSPFDKQYFFRIYDGEGGFTDYKICAEDIKIEILDDSLSLYEVPREGDCKNRLDWSQRTLHGAPGDKIVMVHQSEIDGSRIEEHGHLNDQLKFVAEDIVEQKNEN